MGSGDFQPSCVRSSLLNLLFIFLYNFKKNVAIYWMKLLWIYCHQTLIVISVSVQSYFVVYKMLPLLVEWLKLSWIYPHWTCVSVQSYLILSIYTKIERKQYCMLYYVQSLAQYIYISGMIIFIGQCRVYSQKGIIMKCCIYVYNI